MNIEDLKAKHGGHWGWHPEHSTTLWRHEVMNNDTRLGYWEWVANRLRED